MKTLEITAKSLEEALKKAAAEFSVDQDQLEVEILEEPSKGFLGLLSGKQARILVHLKEEPAVKAKAFLEKILSSMGIKASIFVEEDVDSAKLTIAGNNMGILIGRRGETLDALQYLVNLVANRHASERRRIIVDAEDYRKRREDTLVNLANRLADKVRKTGYRVSLEPMNPQERRIIHTALQNDQVVQTLSEGEEPFRKVVISLRRR